MSDKPERLRKQKMEIVSAYLTPRQKKALVERAEREGYGLAELIRRALDQYLNIDY